MCVLVRTGQVRFSYSYSTIWYPLPQHAKVCQRSRIARPRVVESVACRLGGGGCLAWLRGRVLRSGSDRCRCGGCGGRRRRGIGAKTETERSSRKNENRKAGSEKPKPKGGGQKTKIEGWGSRKQSRLPGVKKTKNPLPGSLVTKQ